MDELNEQRQQRIKKLDPLREAGVAPYGTRFDVKDRAGRLIKLHGEKTKETLEEEKISCTFAGRIVALRRFGKAAFAVLQDGSERLAGLSQERSSLGAGLSRRRAARPGRLDRRDRDPVSHEDQRIHRRSHDI